MSVCQFALPFIHLSVGPSVSPSVCWSIIWSVRWLVRRSVRRSDRPPVCPSGCPSVSRSVGPSVCLSVCLSVRPSVHPDFQILIKNPALQAILTDQYIKRDGNRVTYTIGVKQDVDEMQRNFMGKTKNESVS